MRSSRGWTVQVCIQLLVVAVALIPALQARKDANPPASGYDGSGYYWPKTLIWRGIRRSPGRYWLAYYGFISGTVMGLICRVISLTDTSRGGEVNKKIERYRDLLSAYQTTVLGLGLVYISIVSDQLLDVVSAYLIGMCELQILVDNTRFQFLQESDSRYKAYLTLGTFQATSIFGVALQVKYLPLDKLNAAYSAVSFFISAGATAVLKKRARGPMRRVLGLLVSSAQLAFCIAAYAVTVHIDGVHQAVTDAFLYTTIVSFVLINLCTCLEFGIGPLPSAPHSHEEQMVMNEL